jgi:hypothetical protein
MPKKNVPKMKGSAPRIERFSAKFYAVALSAATSSAAFISPQSSSIFGTRIAEMAELFNLYRFVDIKVSWCSGGGGTTNGEDMAVGIMPGLITASPTTVAAISSLECVNVSWATQNTVTHLHADRAYLLGSAPNKWWKTVPDAGQEDWEENQGEIFFAASASTTRQVMVESVIEFTSFVASTLTPMPRLRPQPSSGSEVCPPAKFGGEQGKSCSTDTRMSGVQTSDPFVGDRSLTTVLLPALANAVASYEMQHVGRITG